MTLYYISYGITQIFRAFEILLLIRVILSWMRIPVQKGSFALFTIKVTDPLLKPFRVILMSSGTGIDLSPMLAFLMLQLLHGLIIKTLELIFY